MMSEMKHTPLPWTKHRMKTRSEHNFVYDIVGPSEVVEGLDGIVGPSNNDRTFVEDEANIDLILKAVNSHYALKAENERLREALSAIRPWMIPGMNWTDETGQLLKAMADEALSYPSAPEAGSANAAGQKGDTA